MSKQYSTVSLRIHLDERKQVDNLLSKDKNLTIIEIFRKGLKLSSKEKKPKV